MMANHPNRSRANDNVTRNPTPNEIRAGRESVSLTQTAAAMVVHTTCRTWQQWEAGDRRMHPTFWELFLLKTGLTPLPLPKPHAHPSSKRTGADAE